MATFYYLGGSYEGRLIKGEVEAENEQSAAQKIRKQHLYILSLHKSNQIGPIDLDAIRDKAFSLFGSELKPIERVLFTTHLASMLKTGVPMIEAIEAFEDKSGSGRTRRMFARIVVDLESGKPLSFALSRYPRTFSPIYTHIISSGESMGTLGETLDYLGRQLRREHELASSLKGALMYPMVVLTVMISVLLFISFSVVPKLLTFAQNIGREPPLPTQILIFLTNILLNYGLLLSILGLVGVALLSYALHTKRGREIFDKIVLKLPLFGELIRKYNLARFCRLLGAFYHYGIPLPTAFTILASSLPNIYYQRAVNRFNERMAHGTSLSTSIEDEQGNLFPRLLAQVLRTAEKSANVDEALTRLAEFYETELENTLKNLTTIIEPILILILGIAVMGIALAVVVPIYQVTTSLK